MFINEDTAVTMRKKSIVVYLKKKKYLYVCEAQVMSAFTVKQYSLTTYNS